MRCSFQIPRYIITLHELLAHTPPDHVEKNSLEQARVQLEDLSRQMHDEVKCGGGECDANINLITSGLRDGKYP